MKIKKITKVKPEIVYAIKTSSSTFIANNLAHHNCVGCNVFKRGNLLEYRDNLIKKIGQQRVDWLWNHRHDTHKYTREELEELLKKYKE